VGISSRAIDDGELAAEAGVAPAYVRELATSGAIKRDRAGRFEADDIPRVRLAAALNEAGIDTDALMWAIDHKVLALSRIGGLWRLPTPGGRRYAEFAASLGSRRSLLSRLYMTFGLAEPSGEAFVSADEEAILVEFLDLWADVDPEPELAMRAARIAGDGYAGCSLPRSISSMSGTALRHSAKPVDWTQRPRSGHQFGSAR